MGVYERGSATVLIGAQWGDEGKGKVSCYLARDADVVARYSGGNNAGHTVVVAGHTFKLHLVPSGVFYPDTLALLGSGMVIDPEGLIEEVSHLRKHGYPCANIRVSPLAHLVFPYHREIDRLQEAGRGQKAIGTTRKGVGPAYADKAERIGIRICDLLDEESFREKLSYNLEVKRDRFRDLNGKLDLSQLLESRKRFAEFLSPLVADTTKLLEDALEAGKKVLCEGAQGTMLDLDFGTYPYVTSSATTSGGVATGLGIPPHAVTEVLGVVKAYTTRVGEGTFPTEETGETGEYLREKGHEYGTTTGRARRCGWLDGMVLRYGHRINGYTGLIVTKLDVLSGLSEVKIAEAYRRRDEILRDFPTDPRVFREARPVYRTFPGWPEDLSGIRRIPDLPKACREYLAFVEEYTGVPVIMVSIGADRDQMIVP